MTNTKPPTSTTPAVLFENGMWLAADVAGNVGFFNASGTEVLEIDVSGSSPTVKSTAGNSFAFQNGNAILKFAVNAGEQISVYQSTNRLFSVSNGGLITFFNGVATAGMGTPPIYGAGVQTLYTNVAPTTLTYTPPATAGVYRLSGYLNALTAGTMTFKVKITYKDAGGNAVTDIPAFYRQNTAAVIAGGMTANTADRYIMFPHTISIDNSATAIAILDNAGTYTAGTYYWTPILEQLA